MDTKPVDAEQFKVGMRTLAGAVNIITSVHSGHRYGMTATAVCSTSAEPPTVLVCINKLANTHGAVVKAGAFCVNVLRAEDWALSTTFSGGQKYLPKVYTASVKSRPWSLAGRSGKPVPFRRKWLSSSSSSSAVARPARQLPTRRDGVERQSQ